ncbi:MAG: hypothetical protein M1814_006791 [Vezdaea aestivalis]|nr:MAG: hypothetical protein M1814_006791 [Vezdaea aestivalis]
MRRRKSGSRKDGGVAGSASWLSSVINLLNTIVGAGVLAMPLAMSHMGMLLGIIVVLWSGLTAAFGLYLQTRCARYLDRGASSFFALSQLTYPNAAVVFDAAIAIKCFGVGISYLIIIGDLMPGVVLGFTDKVNMGFWVDRQFWVTAFMLVVIPLSFLRRLDSLKYTSMIALTSIGYLVILVLAHFLRGDNMAPRKDIRVIHWGGALPALSSFPVIVFAYTCHQNMFSVLNEIADNSPRKTTSVVTSSIGTAAVIYLVVALTGYRSFGNKVTGNIMEMYALPTASTIGKAAIILLVTFSYPLQVHPCRASIDAVLRWRPSLSKSQYAHLPTTNTSAAPTSRPTSPAPLLPQPQKHHPHSASRAEPMSETRFALITTLVLVASYAVAMTVTSLEKVLAYVGSTGSTSISFILPGLFYWKISDPLAETQTKDDDDDGADEEEGWGLLGGKRGERRLRRASITLAVYGVVVMVGCLVTNTFFVVAH